MYILELTSLKTSILPLSPKITHLGIIELRGARLFSNFHVKQLIETSSRNIRFIYRNGMNADVFLWVSGVEEGVWMTQMLFIVTTNLWIILSPDLFSFHTKIILYHTGDKCQRLYFRLPSCSIIFSLCITFFVMRRTSASSSQIKILTF